jgi:hypothetical protein
MDGHAGEGHMDMDSQAAAAPATATADDELNVLLASFSEGLRTITS